MRENSFVTMKLMNFSWLTSMSLLLVTKSATGDGDDDALNPVHDAPVVAVPRDRQCCLYATQSQVCSYPEACMIWKGNEGAFWSPELEVCHVIEDTKKSLDAEKCLRMSYAEKEFRDDWIDHYKGLPFSLNTFLFYGGNAFPGVEVALDYGSDWSSARFRLMNVETCDSNPKNYDPNTSDCLPRCVEILKNHMAATPNSKLLYDCEVGFYVMKNHTTILTEGHTYEFNICIDHHSQSDSDVTDLKVICSSFYFLMPKVKDIRNSGLAKIPLMEKYALERDNIVALHFPEEFLGENFDYNAGQVVLARKNPDSQAWEDLLRKNYSASQHFSTFYFSEQDLNLGSGEYKLAFEHGKMILDFAKFNIAPVQNKTLGVTLFFLFLILAIGASMYIYKRYYFLQNNNVVNPLRLVESGRIKGKSVLIITNVDNRHHIDIVLTFSKYLKSYCAVEEVYFALDDNTGVKALQKEHDPWKWAMEVSEKMMGKNLETLEDACMVFIAAPPSKLGVSIYKDLPNCQAFVTAKYLQDMVDKNRVAILQLPYSDPETIPTLIPAHVREKSYQIPKEMNDFLCQLLVLKKRPLFAFLPFPLVKRQVLASDLSKTKDGEKLMDQITNLTAIVNRFRAEQKAAANGNAGAASTMTRTEETISTFSDSEERNLLSPKRPIIKNKEALEVSVGNKEDHQQTIEIEPYILSLKSKNLDKEVDPEFA